MSRHWLQPLGGTIEDDVFDLGGPVTNRVSSRTTTIGTSQESAVSFTYDANGNLLQGGRRWNPGSLMQDISRYEYDLNNRLLRIQKVETPSDGSGLSEVDRFTYDGA